MSIASDVLRSPKGRIVLGAIAAWALFQLWLTVAAPGKISPELTGTSEKVNVQIELPFTPERFHVLAFQQYGRVSGTDEHSIELRGVKRTDLNAVARPYWVTAVGPIKEGG
ncbi:MULTISPECIES: hypothetical protein [Bradyrhizobium]|jgi:hypothetical protein|uniref:Uncharacterized protein n=1 Tax=Bradyrhizobium ottawaense TaxID=931866 RepID=A0A2U8PJ73_9BRAD|nr:MULTISPECIES: hypothetical protein [Bradyrhizobium]AWL97564.1 hypothetical protein CIT37_39630 [Bradyrhizobium ottawaense]MBR0984935.1 hypothetical protein [Bradyrhizobium liaoningense]MBR1293331.1 hypothetical protein [Bradyrhizobium ottawaense]MBR1327842.1 hypothetical protein [Bradyrhizobium ottawaense]MBR1334632.1 hypothetical protein [Bradyrhizobium ottawaense]